jgi:hypothetical protein
MFLFTYIEAQRTAVSGGGGEGRGGGKNLKLNARV